MIRRLLPFCVLILAGGPGALPLPAADLEAGAAVADITPPPAYRMSGYFNERLNTGLHDPLLAKALVFRQGETSGAIVICDLIGMAPAVTAQARRIAAEKTGIPATHILIAATHSHTGPLYHGALREFFHAQAVEKHGSDPQEKEDYPAALAERIAQAIADAHAVARPVTLASGKARQEGLAFNRRFHMKDGTVRFNPGKLNPDIVKVAGPTDPDVGLLSLKAADGRNVALLTVFALHLDTVGGTEYSADYPFYLDRTMRQTLGNECLSLFGTGTCGDINHVDVSHDRPQKGQEEAARIGTALAETVKMALPELKMIATPRFGVLHAQVDVPLQQYTAEETALAAQQLPLIGTKELSFLDQVRAVKITAVQMRGGPTLPLEVQVFRLGDDTAIVGLPGEVFVELGLDIKARSPFANTLVIELCNDAPAYLPTKKAFAEGSYETVNSLVQPGGPEMLVEAAVRMLTELHK